MIYERKNYSVLLRPRRWFIPPHHNMLLLGEVDGAPQKTSVIADEEDFSVATTAPAVTPPVIIPAPVPPPIAGVVASPPLVGRTGLAAVAATLCAPTPPYHLLAEV